MALPTQVSFNTKELAWLQNMLFNLGEEKWPGSIRPGADPSNPNNGVEQMGPNEHDFFQNMLDQVRDCIKNPTHVVGFGLAGPDQPIAGLGPVQRQFICKLFIDYQGSTAGNYIFKGAYGQNYKEGAQFPTGLNRGSSAWPLPNPTLAPPGANPAGTAQQNNDSAQFGENSFFAESNLFNEIMHKLGQVTFEEVHFTGPYGSPGEI